MLSPTQAATTGSAYLKQDLGAFYGRGNERSGHGGEETRGGELWDGQGLRCAVGCRGEDELFADVVTLLQGGHALIRKLMHGDRMSDDAPRRKWRIWA